MTTRAEPLDEDRPRGGVTPPLSSSQQEHSAAPSDSARISTEAEPFAPFFLLAALDAMLGVAAWLPVTGAASGVLAVAHPQEMLFGYVAAVLCGLLLTASRRWTRSTSAARGAPLVLAAWIAARFAPAPPAALAVFAALPLTALAAAVSVPIIAARDRRDFKVAALLWLFAAAAVAHGLAIEPSLRACALRTALAAKIGLMTVIGGRVAVALTAHSLIQRDKTPPRPNPRALEVVAALAAGLGLAAWAVAPKSTVAGVLLALATLAQAARLARWRGDRALATPPVLAFHVAYGFAVLGFALLAAAVLAPESGLAEAGVHAWTAGAIGGMSLAIMSSMIRRRLGQAFVASPLNLVSFAGVTLAAVLRLVAAFAERPAPVLALASLAWCAAFAAFLLAFGKPLVLWTINRPPAARPRKRP